MKKIAILGGSFNPITKAHIEIARYVWDRNVVDEILIMPCYNHLQKIGLVDFRHRFNMCEIACEPFSGFLTVSNFEASHEMDGSVYDLMEKLREEYADTEFSYIIGMDQANNFHTWKNWEKLKDTTRFIVIPRVGEKESYDRDWYMRSPHLYCPPLLGFPIIDASSTKVREILKKIKIEPLRKYYPSLPNLSDLEEGIKNSTYLLEALDTDVFKYICENRLYVTSTKS